MPSHCTGPKGERGRSPYFAVLIRFQRSDSPANADCTPSEWPGVGFVACRLWMWYKALSAGDWGVRIHDGWCGLFRSEAGFTAIREMRCFMEMAELKGLINDLEARMTKIRDWL